MLIWNFGKFGCGKIWKTGAENLGKRGKTAWLFCSRCTFSDNIVVTTCCRCYQYSFLFFPATTCCRYNCGKKKFELLVAGCCHNKVATRNCQTFSGNMLSLKSCHKRNGSMKVKLFSNKMLSRQVLSQKKHESTSQTFGQTCCHNIPIATTFLVATCCYKYTYCDNFSTYSDNIALSWIALNGVVNNKLLNLKFHV